MEFTDRLCDYFCRRCPRHGMVGLRLPDHWQVCPSHPSLQERTLYTYVFGSEGCRAYKHPSRVPARVQLHVYGPSLQDTLTPGSPL